MTKSQLRQSLKEKISHLTVQQRAGYSETIKKTVLSLPDITGCQHCALYASLPTEVETRSLLSSLKKIGIQCYLPAIQDNRVLTFHAYSDNDSLIKNAFNILEPDQSLYPAYPIHQLDLIICPLIGFDQQGYRLGTGGGYYDTTFQDYPALKKVGLAFNCQIVEQLPIEPWDLPLDMVITETKTYRF